MELRDEPLQRKFPPGNENVSDIYPGKIYGDKKLRQKTKQTFKQKYNLRKTLMDE